MAFQIVQSQKFPEGMLPDPPEVPVFVTYAAPSALSSACFTYDPSTLECYQKPRISIQCLILLKMNSSLSSLHSI